MMDVMKSSSESSYFWFKINYMIKEVSGDIMLTSARVIAHSIAPLDHFESGLALSLRENYPSMVKDFRHYCHQHHPKPGDIFTWGGSDGRQIVNMMAQEPSESSHSHGLPGKADLKHVSQCLKNLVKAAKDENFESLALPKIATGVGGLSWEDVQPLLEKHLSELDIPVYIYSKFVKGQQAEE